MFEQIAFYVFSGLTTIMFLIAVFSRNILYAMSALAAGMIFISGFFFILKADFLGVVQIVVYGGAVMALYAFGMMFFDSAKEVHEQIVRPKVMLVLSAISAILIVFIISAPISAGLTGGDNPNLNELQNPQAIGVLLYTKYLSVFELASVMLLVAVVAGLVLASRKMDTSITTMSEIEHNLEEHYQEFRLSKKSKED